MAAKEGTAGRRFSRFRADAHTTPSTAAGRDKPADRITRRDFIDSRRNSSMIRKMGLPLTNYRSSHVQTAGLLVEHGHVPAPSPFEVEPRSLAQWHQRADDRLVALKFRADDDTHTIRAELRWRNLLPTGSALLVSARLQKARRLEAVLVAELDEAASSDLTALDLSGRGIVRLPVSPLGANTQLTALDLR